MLRLVQMQSYQQGAIAEFCYIILNKGGNGKHAV